MSYVQAHIVPDNKEVIEFVTLSTKQLKSRWKTEHANWIHVQNFDQQYHDIVKARLAVHNCQEQYVLH